MTEIVTVEPLKGAMEGGHYTHRGWLNGDQKSNQADSNEQECQWANFDV